MKKSTFLMVLSLVLALALGVGGTMAYLQDTDSDVNVMTLGNVHIKQIEKERVEQTNSGTDELQDFTQGKPLYPAVGEIAWVEGDNGRVYQQWPTEGANALFDTDKLNNELDKFVFVENTGKSDAYVRTWLAFELADGWSVEDVKDDKMIHLNINDADSAGGGFYKWDWIAEPVTIGEQQYAVACATYVGKGEIHEGGVLPAGETTRPSLLQVFMDKTATNEDIESLGETYDILVFSQAVQTEGFDSAEAALNEAFGAFDATEEGEEGDNSLMLTSLPWDAENLPVIPKTIKNYDELLDAAAVGGKYIVIEDFEMPSYVVVRDGVTLEVDLNGHTLTSTRPAGSGNMYTFVSQEGHVVLNGVGTIISESGLFVGKANTTTTIDGGTYQMSSTAEKQHIYVQNSAKLIINDGIFTTSDDNAALAYCINGYIEINGGFFQNTSNPNAALLSMGNNLKYADNQKITISGGTFVNWNPMSSAFARPWTNPDVPAMIVLADGCEVVEETQENGDIWYTVVKK